MTGDIWLCLECHDFTDRMQCKEISAQITKHKRIVYQTDFSCYVQF